MLVVIEKDCYAGDGCADTGQYTVSTVYGPFTTDEAAKEFINSRPNHYAVEYEIISLKAVSTAKGSEPC
jgi:hypothetical protein